MHLGYILAFKENQNLRILKDIQFGHISKGLKFLKIKLEINPKTK